MDMSAVAKNKGRTPALSPAMVQEAHYLMELGVPLSQVARKYGVRRATVYHAFEREGRSPFSYTEMKNELAQLRAFKAKALDAGFVVSAPSAAGEQVAP